MITFKQFEKDERWALHTIKKFITNHSILVYLIVSLTILFLLASLGIIMLFGVVGGGCIEQNIQEQLYLGQISIEQYNTTMGALDIIGGIFNLISALIGFIISGLFLFWIYIGFKEYLRYNKDNL